MALVRVFVPLSMPGVAAGSVFVFVFTLGFDVLPQLLGSSDQALVGQTIYTQVNQLLHWGRGGALAVILIVTGAVIFVAVAATSRLARAVKQR